MMCLSVIAILMGVKNPIEIYQWMITFIDIAEYEVVAVDGKICIKMSKL